MKHYVLTTTDRDGGPRLVALVAAPPEAPPLCALWGEWSATTADSAGDDDPWAFARWAVATKGYVLVPFTEAWTPPAGLSFRYREFDAPTGETGAPFSVRERAGR